MMALVFLIFLLARPGDPKIKLFKSNANFKAAYFLRHLRSGAELLDPQNTDTVWEYYLLENLSCGLIRDSKTSPSGYEGCIAERFYQTDPQTWVFKIRSLNWSDGTLVSKQELVTWISRLKTNKSRHVQFFRKADEISFDETSRELRIHFSIPDAGMVLHELSLADSGLLPTDFKTLGWKKTIGPYTVSRWDKSSNQLILTSNKHSPLYSLDMPQVIELADLIDQDVRPFLFKTIDVDFVPLGAMADPARIKELLPNAPQVYVCHPTMILFFLISNQNPLAKNLSAREAFANIIRNAQTNFDSNLDYQSTLKVETQMIPEGFDGRLSNAPNINPDNILALGNHKLKIRLTPAFENQKNLLTNLKSSFGKAGITLEINFSDSSSAPSKDEFAVISAFVGNQLDPSGSWSFLIYSAEGALHPWLKNLKERFKLPAAHPSNNEKQSFFMDLHREVLTNFFAVPYLVGAQRYLLSSRVDTARWNRFDSRARFYELRIKHP